MVRTAEQRKQKYEDKIDADVLKQQTSLLKPRMVKNQSAYMTVVTDLETRIKKLVEAEGVTTLEVRDYLNYGRELLDLSRRFSKTTLLTEAQSKLDKWESRGLDPGLLKEVALLLGLSLSGVSAELEHGYAYYRKLARYYWAMPTIAYLSSRTPLATTLYAHPFLVSRKTTYDQIGIYVASQSSFYCALGLYADNGDNTPSDLVLDAGIVATSPTGNKTVEIDLTLERGLYWTALCAEGQFGARASLSSYVWTLLGLSALNDSLKSGYSVTNSPYTPLPSTFPIGMSYDTGNPLIVGLRVASQEA